MADFPDRYDRHWAQSQLLANDCAVKRIGIVLFDGFALPDAAAVAEIFQSANALGETTRSCAVRYEVCLLSAAGDRISSSSSAFVWTEGIDARHDRNKFHALFLSGGTGVKTALRDETLINWLRHISSDAELIFPIAEGRLLLDIAGLGLAAGEPRRRERSPQMSRNGLRARLSPDTTDPLQAALAVVESDLGAEIARQIASGIDPQLETRFTAILRKGASNEVSEKIQTSARWLEMNGDRSITIDEAAKVVAMSTRNFLRRFKTEMGVTPSDYLLFVRLDMCCRLLAETNLPVDKVARRCGIGNGGRLSKIFRRYLGTTPTEYRAIKRRSIESA
ncbi:GlxA family transcriptional regulator [Paraburkholderia sp. GAS348]|uniref:GlxA family transcriptional regulator n=1 Tax=Paraburkholderia sp. GAS348 TaxID=3035132 RepID=UPI003D21C8F9